MRGGRPLKHSSQYTLTHELVAAHGGGPVVCLDERSVGRTFQLHAERPGEQARTDARTYLAGLRADVVSPTGMVEEIVPASDESPCTVIEIRGPLEQRAGYHDQCGGWSDGHDAIAERVCMALCEGDVVLVIDSPGGAHAGLQEAVRRVVETKAQYGRHVVAYADEMIGSAAYWWAAVVADEIYLPEAGVVGSIGARSAHYSTAGACAQDGLAVTYFAWPNAGKVAFAPELPLSDLGKERGERDVNIAGEAFAKAVGAARGLKRSAIANLSADALTGQAAVDAGLADGVACLEDVLGYALASSSAPTPAGGSTATTESDLMPRTKIKSAASYERTTKERYEDDGKVPADEDEKKPNVDPDGDEDGDEDASADDRMDETEADDSAEEESAVEADGDEEPPPSSKPAPPMKKKPAPANHPPPPQQRQARSLAALCGLRDGASEPSIKGALVRKNAVIDAVAALTGTRSEDQMVGQLRSIQDDLARLAAVEADNRKLQGRLNRQTRMDLLRRLSAANLPGYTRGDLLVDEVDDKGTRTTKPSPVYAEMKLGTLRGLVDGKLRNASASTATRRTPFDADPTKAKAAVDAAQLERAVSTPEIQRFAARSTASAEQLARTAAALEAQGAFSNGVH